MVRHHEQAFSSDIIRKHTFVNIFIMRPDVALSHYDVCKDFFRSMTTRLALETAFVVESCSYLICFHVVLFTLKRSTFLRKIEVCLPASLE